MKTKYETWNDFARKIYSPEDVEEAERKADLITQLIAARKEKKLTQRDLESMTGIKQPVIARLEVGKVSAQIGTLLKVLSALGKPLKIVDIKRGKTA